MPNDQRGCFTIDYTQRLGIREWLTALIHYTHIGMLAKRRAFHELDEHREKHDPKAMDSSEESVQ